MAVDPPETLVDRSGNWIPDGSWPFNRNAPGDLEQIRRFLNTVNFESGADLLATAVGVSEWLGNEWQVKLGRQRSLQVAELRQLREVIRGLVADNNCKQSLDDLQNMAYRYPVVVCFDTNTLNGSGRGVATAIGTMLALVFQARIDGSWARLTTCRNEACGWIVFDHSKNRSASWCSDSGCGGRARAKAYRARQRNLVENVRRQNLRSRPN
jgi:predicted RNA-binding Zn ribbon-like protein